MQKIVRRTLISSSLATSNKNGMPIDHRKDLDFQSGNLCDTQALSRMHVRRRELRLFFLIAFTVLFQARRLNAP
jgi:hypothetical protein